MLEAVENIKRKFDAFVNVISGFGGTKDPMVRTNFNGGVVLQRAELELMYRFDWATRKVVEIIPEDATREGIEIKTEDPELVARLNTEMDRLNVMQKFEKALNLSRLHGGSIILIGALDGAGEDATIPLNIDKVYEVAFLNVFDRWQLHVHKRYDDPLSAKFGEPEIYEIRPITHNKRNVAGSKVHETRVLRFDGVRLPAGVCCGRRLSRQRN